MYGQRCYAKTFLSTFYMQYELNDNFVWIFDGFLKTLLYTFLMTTQVSLHHPAVDFYNYNCIHPNIITFMSGFILLYSI